MAPIVECMEEADECTHQLSHLKNRLICVTSLLKENIYINYTLDNGGAAVECFSVV